MYLVDAIRKANNVIFQKLKKSAILHFDASAPAAAQEHITTNFIEGHLHITLKIFVNIITRDM